MSPVLGCIADDFTGATDLANMLTRHGMRSVQWNGLPQGPLPEADALVIALKIRTIPAAEAVAAAAAACDALIAAGARQIFWKYCSTFDSTAAGNIGPVGETLMRRLGTDFAIATPAYPANQRTVYLGHLFVGTALLHESGMQNHPLTPMTDPNLVRVLARQSEKRVGLVPFAVVEQGAGAIRRACEELRWQGYGWAIIDALTQTHLQAIGEAAAEHPLVTGGAGVAMGLPENFRRAGLLPPRPDAAQLPPRRGFLAVLAGSCSPTTLAQIEHARARMPLLVLDPLALPDAAALAAAALTWAEGRLSVSCPLLIATSAPPEQVHAVQRQLGREAAAALIEEALARIAEGLVARGVGALVVAGGETAGAVVSRLGIRVLQIGAEIDPGIPWTYAPEYGLHLALKSGNFGAADFFLKAFAHDR